jgi:predicted Holliday junction resolvase-like endonuclease
MSALVHTVNGIQEILGICPCCGEILRLAEAKFIFPKETPKTCEYLDLVTLERRVADDDSRVSTAEERFEEKLDEQRSTLIDHGRRKAKRQLRKIDPIFSARGIDPQDVKVIFEPVEYIIFHGLNSAGGVSSLEFVSRPPETRTQEVTVTAVDNAIRNGNVEFETLHMCNDGSLEVRTALRRKRAGTERSGHG